ncbi:MAG TPA: alanine--tRNA ligase [bacterium]|nr:alanine--tRNA ligase [bacterium]
MKTGAEVREIFLRYFEGQGHTRVRSASLVPAGDPTLLFTNAGMVQFKDVFLGLEQRPYLRATTVQKCMRVSGKHNDLESVGPSPRHHTFFEMLGNFSFGDYFKRDAVRFAWELATGTFGIPRDRLVLTVFQDDDEAADAWAAVGVPRDRVLRMGEKTNFWMMGDVGPCGPTSELHYDWGPDACTCGRPDCSVALDNDCGRWLEVWNLVFMQFNQAPDGARTPLPKPGVDTGMGLERILSVLQHAPTNYDTDLFLPILDGIQTRILGHNAAQRAAHTVAYRVLADHGRAMTFLVADGVVPGNEGRSYVLRMIMRRAMRFARRMIAEDPGLVRASDRAQALLPRVADEVIAVMGDAYPEVVQQRSYIHDVLGAEEARFERTLDAGLERLDALIAETRARGGSSLPGVEVFRLYDTYGFPPDLTRDVAREHGMELDEAEFSSEMERQRERSRGALAFKFDAPDRTAYGELRDAGTETEFVGYDTLEAEGRVLALLAGGRRVSAVDAGQDVEIVCDRTPFYAEAGGQVGDTGELRGPSGAVEVRDTQRPVPGVCVHHGRVTAGLLREGDRVRLAVESARRGDIARNHTATHLLHKALREILGEHARQAGSLVAPDRLRFDFVHMAALTPDELTRVEDRVNAQILGALPVETAVMPYREAVDAGAMALFGEKYGDEVRVVSVDAYSRELCGGTHVRVTSEIGLFLVTNEGSVGAGARRLEAVTGRGASERLHTAQTKLREAAAELRVAPEALPERVKQLEQRRRAVERGAERARVGAAVPDLDALVRSARDVDGIAVVGVTVAGADQAALRALGDRVKPRLPAGVIVAAGGANGRIELVVMATPGAVERGAAASKVMQALNRRLGTRGGGRPELAQGGGGDPERLAEALDALPEIVREVIAGAAGGRR